MEDKQVKVGMFAYQIRVDTSDNQVMQKFVKHYNVPWYLYGMEKSAKGKPHIQSIVWFSKKVNTAKLRNWLKGKADKTKQPVAVTQAKKVESLIKYCSKDGNVYTNLLKKDLEKLGKWQDKQQLKKEFKDKLYAYAESIAFKKHTVTKDHTDYATINSYYETDLKEYEVDEPTSEEHREFCTKIFDFYRKHDRFPVRRVVHALLFKYNYTTSENLYQNWFL